MTTWVENPETGRGRGPRAALRAWVEVVVRPRRFFRTGVAPGDQGPGFVFTVLVAFAATTLHLALVPDARPDSAGSELASSALLVAGLSLLAAPLALHLVAAVETVALLALSDRRGTISETVQVLAYATAPCVLAGVPHPAVTFAAALYGSALLALGTATVHDLSAPRAVTVSAVPAALVFGVAYRGLWAAEALAAGF